VERRRQKSLRIGVHHGDGVVWELVYRTHLKVHGGADAGEGNRRDEQDGPSDPRHASRHGDVRAEVFQGDVRRGGDVGRARELDAAVCEAIGRTRQSVACARDWWIAFPRVKT
jgi:hypothetical protein